MRYQELNEKCHLTTGVPQQAYDFMEFCHSQIVGYLEDSGCTFPAGNQEAYTHLVNMGADKLVAAILSWQGMEDDLDNCPSLGEEAYYARCICAAFGRN